MIKKEQEVEMKPEPNKRKFVDKPGMRKKLRKGKSSMSMDKSASSSRASMDTDGLDDIEQVVDWSVLYDRDKVMIMSKIDGIDVIFNPYNGKVEDKDGKRYLVSRPDVNILATAEDIRRTIRPPELIEIEGMKRVKSERSVYVDPTD